MLSSHDPVRVKTEKLSTSPPTTAIGRLRLRSSASRASASLIDGASMLSASATRVSGPAGPTVGTDAPSSREERADPLEPTLTATSTATAAARG